MDDSRRLFGSNRSLKRRVALTNGEIWAWMGHEIFVTCEGGATSETIADTL